MSVNWSRQHNGVMLCSFEKTVELMPDVAPILEEVKPLLEFDEDEYLVDVKVHMLMPGEFPCIPNWHSDFVPRDENLKRKPQEITGEKMYLWISGEPYTEFKDGSVEAGKWKEFTQHDVHRGVASEVHTWRGFIRVIPKKFVHPTTINVGQLRRHTQVYLDAKGFSW